MHKIKELSNKINIITAPLHDTQAVTALVMVKVGSRYETAGLNGISHFIEHLLFKGTKKRPTSLDISRELDGIGADYNAFTSKQNTGYYIKASKENLELSLEILADMLFNSLFDPKEIDRERGVILEEINMFEDNPMMYIGDIYEETVFSGSQLGQKISGPKENIKNISHKQITDFYKKYYTGANIIVGLAGNFNESEAIKLVKKYFGRAKAGAGKNKFKKFTALQKQPRVNILNKETQQVQMVLGFPSYKKTDPKIYSLIVLAAILGGGMSSRLFTEIREKQGLCYFIRAAVDSFEDTGSFYIQSGLEQSSLEKAIITIKKELLKIKDKGVKAEELSRAKEFIKGKLILKLEDSANLISWLTEQKILAGKTETLKAKLKKVSAVTIKDLKQAAKEIINFKKANLALIGPYHDKEKFLHILKTK